MLVADLAFVRHPVELDLEIVLEDRFRIYGVVRRGTLWDTRIAPPAPGPAPDAVFFYFVLAGTMVWDAPLDLRVEGGQALVATQAALEGENGKRTATHASFGEPFHVVQLRVARELVRDGLGREPTLVVVTDEVRAALALFAHAPTRTHDARVARTSELLRAVYRAGLVVEDLSHTITREEGLAERMWAGAVPFFRDVYLAPSLTELSDKVGLCAPPRGPRDVGDDEALRAPVGRLARRVARASASASRSCCSRATSSPSARSRCASATRRSRPCTMRFEQRGYRPLAWSASASSPAGASSPGRGDRSRAPRQPSFRTGSR